MSLNETIKKIKLEMTTNNPKLIIITVNGNENNSLIKNLQNLGNIDILNLNFLLSQILITLPKNKLSDPVKIIENIITKNSSKNIILFSSINILFDVNLKWNPLQILKKLSRNHFLIVLWNGKYDKVGLDYASYPHQEHVKFSIQNSTEIFII